MSQTNDRRKTFNTPLDWLRWALEQPGLRIAKTKNGHLCKIEISGREKIVSYRVETDNGALGLSDCPLTAVEDEHGVIEEKQSQDYITDIEAAIGIIAVIEGDIVPASREAYTQTSTGLLIDAIRKIADERIAAAKVEWYGPHGNWAVDHNCRLKPKGDA